MLWAQFLIGFGLLTAPRLIVGLAQPVGAWPGMRYWFVPWSSALQALPSQAGLLLLLVLTGEPLRQNGLGRVEWIRVTVGLLAGSIVLGGLGWMACRSVPRETLSYMQEMFPVEFNVGFTLLVVHYFLPIFAAEFVYRAFLQTRLELLLNNRANALLAMVALDVLAVSRLGFDQVRFGFLFSLALGGAFLYTRCAWVPALLAGGYAALFMRFLVNR